MALGGKARMDKGKKQAKQADAPRGAFDRARGGGLRAFSNAVGAVSNGDQSVLAARISQGAYGGVPATGNLISLLGIISDKYVDRTISLFLIPHGLNDVASALAARNIMVAYDRKGLDAMKRADYLHGYDESYTSMECPVFGPAGAGGDMDDGVADKSGLLAKIKNKITSPEKIGNFVRRTLLVGKQAVPDTAGMLIVSGCIRAVNTAVRKASGLVRTAADVVQTGGGMGFLSRPHPHPPAAEPQPMGWGTSIGRKITPGDGPRGPPSQAPPRPQAAPGASGAKDKLCCVTLPYKKINRGFNYNSYENQNAGYGMMSLACKAMMIPSDPFVTAQSTGARKFFLGGLMFDAPPDLIHAADAIREINSLVLNFLEDAGEGRGAPVCWIGRANTKSFADLEPVLHAEWKTGSGMIPSATEIIVTGKNGEKSTYVEHMGLFVASKGGDRNTTASYNGSSLTEPEDMLVTTTALNTLYDSYVRKLTSGSKGIFKRLIEHFAVKPGLFVAKSIRLLSFGKVKKGIRYPQRRLSSIVDDVLKRSGSDAPQHLLDYIGDAVCPCRRGAPIDATPRHTDATRDRAPRAWGPVRISSTSKEKHSIELTLDKSKLKKSGNFYIKTCVLTTDDKQHYSNKLVQADKFNSKIEMVCNDSWNGFEAKNVVVCLQWMQTRNSPKAFHVLSQDFANQETKEIETTTVRPSNPSGDHNAGEDLTLIPITRRPFQPKQPDSSLKSEVDKLIYSQRQPVALRVNKVAPLGYRNAWVTDTPGAATPPRMLGGGVEGRGASTSRTLMTSHNAMISLGLLVTVVSSFASM